MRNQVKKELRKGNQWLLVAAVALFSQVTLADSSSTDGASLSQPVATIRVGKALLTVEDLKTLLGVQSRDPSAAKDSWSNKDGLTSAPHFKFALSHADRASLVARIKDTERERAQLETKLTQEMTKQKAEIRAKRKTLQASRIGASANSDDKLSKSLFESLLSEANAEAKVTKELHKFDASHMVALNFEEMFGTDTVKAIFIGDNNVWTTRVHEVAAR